jgi:hypothetical protein
MKKKQTNKKREKLFEKKRIKNKQIETFIFFSTDFYTFFIILSFFIKFSIKNKKKRIQNKQIETFNFF